MRASVDIDDATFWKLANHAEQYDMRVDEYLSELAFIASRQHRPPEVDPVLSRVRRGLTDKAIARELGMTNHAVSSRRQRAGFPANKRKRETA